MSDTVSTSAQLVKRSHLRSNLSVVPRLKLFVGQIKMSSYGLIQEFRVQESLLSEPSVKIPQSRLT